MNVGSQALAFLTRFGEVTLVTLQWAVIIIRRWATSKPIQGPMLLREYCERLSGSFLKLGQILSLQLDSLPKEYCDALLSLLDKVPSFPREGVDGVFAAEFGKTPLEMFHEFDYNAIAAASIGQVHKAKLRDGTAVAVKVQRP